MMWEPDLASVPLEELMEREDVSESDRDEVRRFAEFLRLKKAAAAGKVGAPEGMKGWLLGADGK